MGDVVITLPYLQYLRNILPETTQLDLLTREETGEIPQSMTLFNQVHLVGGDRDYRKMRWHTLTLLPRLVRRHYDAVIDLQNNGLSRMVRRLLFPDAWSAFDRFSPSPAGERNRRSIEALGLGKIEACHRFELRTTNDIDTLLQENGWNPECRLIMLNPAGAFENRNWPIENYMAFVKHWLQEYPVSQFLIMGMNSIAGKAGMLKDALGDAVINLVGKTTPATAFSVVQRVSFVLSEDSGLMHMAWISGIPTLAMFGSTRSDWSRPLGLHTTFVDSSDLACGNCMREQCMFDDERKNQCMTRYSPAYIFEKAQQLLRVNHSLPANL
jgi:ADP-heptose:LPS heptosyltransferase